MKRIGGFLTAILIFCAVALFVFAPRPAQAAPTTGSCPRLAATPYVLAGTSMGGSHYVVMVANEDCAQVSSWIKKIVAQRLSGTPDEDMSVKGPPGYSCTASLDGRGHPYQGRCEKTGNKDTAFSWVMGG